MAAGDTCAADPVDTRGVHVHHEWRVQSVVKFL